MSVSTPLSPGRTQLGKEKFHRFVATVRDRHAAFALVLYLVVAVTIERDVVAHLASACACIAGSSHPQDFSVPTAFMWALEWWPRAVLHLQNPFVAKDVWTPEGLDLARATSVPAAALLASPLTALFGPLVAFNVLTILAPVSAAWAGYRLCLYISKAPLPSVLGGYLYGFSSYELAHVLGLLHTIFIFAPPLCVLLTLKLLAGDIGRRRYAVLLTVTLIVQLLLSTEIFLSMTMMGAASLAAGWIFSPASRRQLTGALRPIAVAYAATAVLCLPYLFYALAQGSEYAAGSAITYSSDLLNFFTPTGITWLGGHSLTSVTSQFSGDIAEDGAYLGVPLLALIIVFAVQWRRSAASKILVSLLLVAGLWSLGPKLHIAGTWIITLPAAGLGHLPVLDQLIPARIAVYVALTASVIVALWLSAGHGRWFWRWVLAAAVVVSLLPNTDAVLPGTKVTLFHSKVTQPAFFATHLYRNYLKRNEIVLPLPWGRNGASMLWQAQAGLYFRMASGHFGSPPPGYRNEPIVSEFLGGRLGRGSAAQLRGFIVRRHVGAVIQAPGHALRWVPVLTSLGLRPIHVGGVFSYQIPNSWTTGS